MTSRRRVLTGAAAAAGFLTVSGGFIGARAQSATWAKKAADANEKELVIAGGTGAYVELVKKHFYDPFTAATGIKVTNAGGSYGEKLAKLKAMTSVGRVEWDLMTLSIDALTPETSAMLRDLATLRRPADRDGERHCGRVPEACGHLRYRRGRARLHRDAFPGAKPASWADFWDVKTFPDRARFPTSGIPGGR